MMKSPINIVFLHILVVINVAHSLHSITTNDGRSLADLLAQDDQPGDLYQIFTGDTQFWVACTENYTGCQEAVNCSNTNLSPETCAKVQSEWANKAHLASLSTVIDVLISTSGHGPRDLVINGDLTQNGYEIQLRRFRESWLALEQATNITIRPGLGNHDYEHCQPGDAQRMLQFMQERIQRSEFAGFDHPKIVSAPNQKTITSSLAYSWDQDGYHFVQLHNYPFYEDQFDTLSESWRISDTLKWLKSDLEYAKNRSVVLNFHNPSLASFEEVDIMTNSAKWDQFFEIIDKYNVIGIFFAHWHDKVGILRSSCRSNEEGSKSSYPLAFAGSVPGGGYSLVRFRDGGVADVFTFLVQSWEETIVRKEILTSNKC